MVVPQNQAAQLAPADEETQEPVEHNHEDPVEEVGEQDDGDDMEPQQVEQVPLRRSSRRRLLQKGLEVELIFSMIFKGGAV